MILEADIGNTRITWRLRSEKTILLSSAGNSTDAIDSIIQLAGLRPTAVCVSTVVNSMKHTFSQWSRDRLGIEPQYALVTRREAGVTNSYKVLSQMGVDRWLAVLAAFQSLKGPCIVVDCGTACTIDVIGDGGQHMGGYIVPGLKMMSDVLFRDTAGVKPSGISYVLPPVLGQSTDDAVAAGLPAMIIGLIDYTLRDYSSDKNRFSLLLTGGDGEQFKRVLADRLDLNVAFNAELVLDGLQYASFTSGT